MLAPHRAESGRTVQSVHKHLRSHRSQMQSVLWIWGLEEQPSVFWIVRVFTVKVKTIAAYLQGCSNILLLLSCQTDGVLSCHPIVPTASDTGEAGNRGQIGLSLVRMVDEAQNDQLCCHTLHSEYGHTLRNVSVTDRSHGQLQSCKRLI